MKSTKQQQCPRKVKEGQQTKLISTYLKEQQEKK